MAAVINVACTLTVKVDVGSGLSVLGYTTSGAQIAVRTFQTPVHTDEYGGPNGLPADIIDHGQLHTVTLELAKYDSAILNVLETFRSAGTPGSVGSPCVLMKGDSKSIRLLLTGTNFTRNYLVAIPTGEIRIGPIGSQATVAAISFDCYPNTSNVIHNSTAV